MIKIENLNVNVEEKEILKGINLEVKPGELHVIMGRNGTGKSTLANVLVGKEKYIVTNGTVSFNGENFFSYNYYFCINIFFLQSIYEKQRVSSYSI